MGRVGRLDGQPWGCTAPLEMLKPQGLPSPGSSSSRSRGLPCPPTQRSLSLGVLGSRHETGSPEASSGAQISPLPQLCAGSATPDTSRESPDPSGGRDSVQTPSPEASAAAVSRVCLPGRVRALGPASQLKSRAQPELSQARHSPETPSLERVPRVHFGSGSRPRNGQQVDLMEATNGWATQRQSSQG